MRKYKSKILTALGFSAAASALVCVTVSGCGNAPTEATASASPVVEASGITHKMFADAVHAVMLADRTVYATHVVTRLKKQEAPVTPSEYWEDEEHTIPLPAQMFRMGSEIVSADPANGFTYGLKSKWPLNPQHAPKSEKETEALDFLSENPGEAWYGEETIGEQNYFTAIYPDRAVAEACWTCHNDHANRGEDYPEFAKDDVMGGVLIRIPM